VVARRQERFVFWFLASTIALYGSAVLSASFFSDGTSMGDGAKVLTPDLAAFGRREFVRIETEDGESLLLACTTARCRPLVIFLHGSEDAPDRELVRFLGLASAGFGVLARISGYGESSGYPTERGLCVDAAAVLPLRQQPYPSERIALWGFSLGSAVAVCLPARRKLRPGLEASFTSLDRSGQELAAVLSNGFYLGAIAFTRMRRSNPSPLRY